jgi:hypothetical protein
MFGSDLHLHDPDNFEFCPTTETCPCGGRSDCSDCRGRRVRKCSKCGGKGYVHRSAASRIIAARRGGSPGDEGGDETGDGTTDPGSDDGTDGGTGDEGTTPGDFQPMSPFEYSLAVSDLNARRKALLEWVMESRELPLGVKDFMSFWLPDLVLDSPKASGQLFDMATDELLAGPSAHEEALRHSLLDLSTKCMNVQVSKPIMP